MRRKRPAHPLAYRLVAHPADRGLERHASEMLVRVERHHRLEHRQAYLLTGTGALAVIQGDCDRVGGVHRRHLVSDARGNVARLTGRDLLQHGKSRQRMDDVVIGRPAAVLKSFRMAIDESRVCGRQRRVGDAETPGGTGANRMQQHFALVARRRNADRPCGDLRSSTTLRLLRLLARNSAPIPSCRRGPMERVTSPSGPSTLMTSAPMSPRNWPAIGPKITDDKSSTARPTGGPGIATAPARAWCCWAACCAR